MRWSFLGTCEASAVVNRVGNIDLEKWSGSGEPGLWAAAGWAPLCAHREVFMLSPWGGGGREKERDPSGGLLRSKPEMAPECISPHFPGCHSNCPWELRWHSPTSHSFSSYFGFQLHCLNISHLPTNGQLSVLMSFLVSLANPDSLVIELSLVSGFAGTAFLWRYIFIWFYFLRMNLKALIWKEN